MSKFATVLLAAMGVAASPSERVRSRSAVQTRVFSESSVDTVQSTWEDIVEYVFSLDGVDTADQAFETAGMLFYGNFFKKEFPAVRDLYPADADMPALAVKLIATLNYAITNLDNLDDLVPALQALATQHIGFCVYSNYFPPVVSGVQWVVKTVLGDAYTQEVKDSWDEILAVVGAVMSAEMDKGPYGDNCVQKTSFDGVVTAEDCAGDSHGCCDAGDSCEDDSVAKHCVCTFDSFCCNTAWDQQCIEEAMSACDMTC